MSYKRERLIAALYVGKTPEEAAAEAGYGEKYARHLAASREVREAIERRRRFEAQRAEAAAEAPPKTPQDVLEGMAYDALLDPRVRIAAIKALAMLEARHQDGERYGPVTIIDDVDPENPAKI
jgi:hypothetical protein